MDKPRIDVLVPCYNGEKLIGRCLDSILQQTYDNFNIIIVDDGSKDNTYNIIKEYADKDKRIILYHKENEKSIAITRNYLLSKIESDLFVFVDSDDMISPYFLEQLQASMEQTGSDVACCEYTIRKRGYTKKNRIKDLTTLEDHISEELILGKRGHFMLWNKLIKREVLKDIKFHTEMKFGEDLVFVLDILKNVKKISFIKNKLYYYMLTNSASITKGGVNKGKVGFLNKLLEIEADPNYEEYRSELTSWTYITAGLYRYLVAFRKSQKEYRDFLKQTMRARKKHYKADKRIRFGHRFLMCFWR